MKPTIPNNGEILNVAQRKAKALFINIDIHGFIGIL